MTRRCPICPDPPPLEPRFEVRDRMHFRGGPLTLVQCPRCALVSYEPFPARPEDLADCYPADYYAYGPADATGPDAVLPNPGGPGAGPTDLPIPEEPRGLRRTLDDLHLGLRGPLAAPRNLPLAVALAPLLWYKEVYSYARFLRPVPRGRLLDVGCGDGRFLLKARRMGFTVEGLEPWGSAAANLAGLGIPVHTCPLESLDPAGRQYDVITLNHVIEHLIDPRAALTTLAGLLAPGGRMLVRTPNTRCVGFRRLARHWYPLEMPRHLHLFDAANLTALAGQCGLRVGPVAMECFPTHWMYLLKSLLFGRDFSSPHWLDHRAFEFLLLPPCGVLKLLGHADCMALWMEKG